MTVRTFHRRALLTLLLPLAAQAQTDAPRLSQMVEVTVASIEVVVTDETGNRVRGLTRDDFLLYENGVLQPITNFSAIGDAPALAAPAAVEAVPIDSAAAPAPDVLPPRRVVIFVDLKTTEMFQRRRVASSVSGILDSLGPRDEVMVVSWNGTLVIEVEPTSDHVRVREGFARLARRASITRTAKLRLEQGTSPTWRRQTVQMLTNDLKRSVVALRVLLRQMAPVSGRKALILISEGFQLQPGRELFMVSNPADMDIQALFDLQSEEGPKLIRSLADSANSAGVTLYAIHGGGLSTHRSAEDLSILPEIPAENPEEPRPLRNFELPQTSDESEMVRERILNSVEGMTELAERSGGTVTKNLNDFKAAFSSIAQDLTSYYSLGYRVVTGGPSGIRGVSSGEPERRLEVRMRDPKLTARARTSIPVRTPAMEIADAVLGRLAFPGGSNDLEVRAIAAQAERSGRRRLSVPIDVLIPLQLLSFTEEGEAFAADLSVYLVAVDSSNANTEVRRFDLPLRIAKEDFGSIGGTHYTYRLTLDLRSRSVDNRVAIGVLDNTSKLTGFAVLDIDEDDLAKR